MQYKKAVILTYAKISDEEKELLKNSKVFKIACNNYCADLKPNIRLCADDIVQKCLDCDTCPVISLNYSWGKDKRIIEAGHLPKRHSSLISCIDWLIINKFTHILLVANNLQATGRDIKEDMQKINREGVNNLKKYLYLYKYSNEGVFDIPQKSVKEFLMEEILTDEEMILGCEEPEKRLLDATVLTDACLYEIHTEELDNVSVENGELVNTILSIEDRTRLMKGELQIESNGLIIKRITKLKADEVEETDEDEEENEPEENEGENDNIPDEFPENAEGGEYVTPDGLTITVNNQDETKEDEDEEETESIENMITQEPKKPAATKKSAAKKSKGKTTKKASKK